ncbi:hypothetical protein G5V58_17680 [Nocardioides anomalus]|uniref:Uncharacterized protein n=1 Tax=Nocardioides anomalus TaxID=2712223 RepID=A0A6G6WGK5_9ACTN|nr:hypothetical protein [Nocardioides anomalus]QIG44364.1 hypothetical protein G5V58_17680 [Nocardioides anomalus]
MTAAVALVRAVAAALAEVVRLVLVDPVRGGRLRPDRWPPGLAAIVSLAGASFVAAAALVLTGPTLRRQSDLVSGLSGDLVYPRWTTPVFLALVVVTLALLHAASLHLSPWLRLGVLLFVVLAVLASALDTYDDNRPAALVSASGALLLVLLTAARWRAAFRWWEFVVSLVVIGATLGVATRLVGDRAQPFGFDPTPTSLVQMAQLVSSLSVPFTFVAGLAFAQLAVLLTRQVGAVVDERVGPTPLLGVVVGVVAVVQVVLVVLHLRVPTGSGSSHVAELGAAGLLLVLALALGVGVVLRSARAETGVLDRLDDAVATLAFPVAAALSASVLAALVLTRVDTQIARFTGGERLYLDDAADALFKSATVAWTRVLIALGLLAWALWQRHRRPLPATFAAAIGTVILVTAVGRASDRAVDLPWTSEALTDVAGVLWLVVLLALAATRRLDRRRLVAVGTALGLSLAYSVRSTFDAPFVTVLGLGASAAVFLGVVWATLTDADEANGDSERYPRPARVLFFLANALLAMSTLAFLAVADTEGLGIDVSAFGTLGDDFLGTGLLLTAYAALAWEVLSPRAEPIPPRSPAS